MKKLVSIVLAMALLLSLVSVASAEGQTEFNVLSGISALSAGYENSEVLNAMQEQAGVTIKWDTWSDSLGEVVGTRISGNAASREPIDAFQAVGFSNYDLMRYGSAGTFIDLTPYITPEIMPNLSAILESHPVVKAAITMSDGKIYGLPAGEQMGTAGIGREKDYSIFSVPQFSMINKAWLDDLGLEVPTTLDELHTVLTAFKENDMSAKYYGNEAGSTIPMSTGFDEWCWGQNVFYAGFGFTNWINDVCMDLVVDKDGKVNFVSDDDNYRAALTYFHDWFAEGLMDLEMFSQDTNQLIAKCSGGRVGVSTWWEINEIMGEHAADYVYLPILTGPDGDSNVNLRTGGATNAGQLSITAQCKDPAKLLSFYDLWYAGENVMQLQYGPIGVYFTAQDEKGMWISITDEESREKYNKSSGELKAQMEVAGPKLILSEYYNEYFYMEDRAQERLADTYDYWMQFVKDDTFYPQDCVFTESELDDIDYYRPDFEKAVAEQEALWIKNGGPTDQEWEAYKSYLERCGMSTLLEIYQNVYDRYLAAQ
ncbi:MAG: extracellular solute-binding protein [Clostridia bacterium]|nr:extracellular solute-binding protein [Clostridia bacterium]